MRTLFYFLGVFAATIYMCAESEASKDKDFDACVADLGMQKMDLRELSSKPAFPCLLACLQEKAGVMAFGKIQLDRYIENYMESLVDNPNDIYLIRAKLVDCATKANKQTDKCMVADYTRKCEADYQEILFP